jgi:hypothetical protein
MGSTSYAEFWSWKAVWTRIVILHLYIESYLAANASTKCPMINFDDRPKVFSRSRYWITPILMRTAARPLTA